MLPLSVQHLFAMFGATVLVPFLFKVDPATSLLMNGVGTLLYLLICKGRIPAHLGSSFAFISPVFAVLARHGEGAAGYSAAQGGYIAFGPCFVAVSLLVRAFGIRWIDVVFPPAAMGTIVAVIGLELAPVAAKMSGLTADAPDPAVIGVAMFTLAVAVLGSVLFRGFLAVIPILTGVLAGYALALAGYALALAIGLVDLSVISAAPAVAAPAVAAPAFYAPLF
ncbi:MAG: hypothetical protein FJ087_15750 [Deltaproteobacteria bacterium]|nr:hypothetical protein [Deltaproteobacteria bacterium]